MILLKNLKICYFYILGQEPITHRLLFSAKFVLLRQVKAWVEKLKRKCKDLC